MPAASSSCLLYTNGGKAFSESLLPGRHSGKHITNLTSQGVRETLPPLEGPGRQAFITCEGDLQKVRNLTQVPQQMDKTDLEPGSV